MVAVHENLNQYFKNYSPDECPTLVLHIHDELLYEVPNKHLIKTAKIIKKSMETSVKLSVPFPVKLKSGKSWGEMYEMDLS